MPVSGLSVECAAMKSSSPNVHFFEKVENQ